MFIHLSRENDAKMALCVLESLSYQNQCSKSGQGHKEFQKEHKDYCDSKVKHPDLLKHIQETFKKPASIREYSDIYDTLMQYKFKLDTNYPKLLLNCAIEQIGLGCRFGSEADYKKKKEIETKWLKPIKKEIDFLHRVS